ncbi:MAG TPA: hypothetical protein VK449_06890 [Anaerolineales bacterium]|nr:hypothetical protein [Anaerolineales bacterium]
MPSTFELLCAGLIALGFGLVVLLNGYKLFLILLPIWGFLFGFVFGAETIQALFNVGFLATVTSWVVGFIVGAVFAVLSYLFWIAAVAIFSGMVGYAIGVGLMGLIGLQSGLIPWLVGVAAGVALAIAVVMLNLQKWVIIIGSAVIGAGVIIGTFLVLFGVVPPMLISGKAVSLAVHNSVWWMIGYLVLFVAGVLGQYRTTREFTLTPPADRW